MVKVFIDPGHGGKDPGAVGDKLKEKDVTLAVGIIVANELAQRGVDLILSRDEDRYRTLTDRCLEANEEECDILVSIHCNAVESSIAKGYEIIHGGREESIRLAESMADAFSVQSLISARRPSVKSDMDTGRGPFTMVRKPVMPCIIVEMGFISNPTDRDILAKNQGMLAECIVNGIMNYFGLNSGTVDGEPVPADNPVILAEAEPSHEPALREEQVPSNRRPCKCKLRLRR